jgi:D-alanyl-D-alanine carboxypeptidase
MTPDRLLGIASIGKTFVAAVVLQLVEEGRLELDSPAAELLPGQAAVTNGATVRQLLNHTSGIFDFVRHPDSLYGVGLEGVDPDARWSAEKIVPALVGEPYFSPGEGWHYSSTNYVLLGMIVEKLTGRSLAEEVRARLLEPLEMNDIHVSLREGQKLGNRIDHGWCDRDGDGDPDAMSELPLPAITPWADGVMYSTARDLARWAELLYSGEVIGAPLMEQMLDFHRPTPGEDWLDGYGLGTATGDLGGIRWQGHGGKDYGISAVMAHFPEQNAVLVVLCNEGGKTVEAVAYSVARALLEGLGGDH